MARTKFYLDCRRTEAGKPAVLKIAISQNSKSSYISLDVKLIPKVQWDGQAIKAHPEKMVLNAFINEIKQKVDAHIINLMRDGLINSMTANEIRDSALAEIDPDKKKEKEDQTSFLYRFNKYASRMSAGSKRTYDHTLNRLEAFTAQPGQKALAKLKFEDLTIDWLTEFDKFMAKTAGKNTRNIHFRNIRTVFNDAIDDNITTFYPFRRFKIKNEVTPGRAITVEELRQLIWFDCEEHAKKYRDYFVLMFLLMGINNVDLCKATEITKGRLVFNRTKTNHFFSMKVEPEAMTIIEKYKGEGQLLDILDHWSTDENFRRKMNKTLQKIGPVTRSGLGGKKKYSPMFPKLTTYYARHTWASIASDLEIPDSTISEGLGHEHGNKVTRGYIHKYSYKNIDKANRKVIDWVLYGIIDGKVVVEPGTPEFFGLEKKEAVKLGLVKESPKTETAKTTSKETKSAENESKTQKKAA